MKKLFLNPEIETVELTPAENIMAIDLVYSAEKGKGTASSTHSFYDTSTTNGDTSVWRGFGD